MFARIGHLVTARPKRVLLVAGVLLIICAAVGIRAPGRLLGAGFTSPSSPSQQVANRLDADFKAAPNLVFLVTARQGSVDSPAVAAAGDQLAASLTGQPGVAAVTSYWATHAPQLRSHDGRQALVIVDVAGTDKQVATRTKALVSHHTVGAGAGGPVTVGAGGTSAVNNAISTQIGKDLAKAEGLAVPITMVLLLLSFGSVVAALLPLITGVCAILATLAVLFGLSEFTDVSTYSLNMTTAMGLGLGIDSALLIVNRYREELGAGLAPPDAVRRTVETAGRTVVFSAATVAAALATLLVFPIYFLRSFAYAGVAVVVVGTLAAVIVLPSVLALLGERVNAAPIRRRALTRDVESPFWRRVGQAVMRRPVAAGVPVLILLLAVGTPFLSVHFGPPDDRVVPASTPARQVDTAVRAGFASGANDTLDVVTSSALSPPAAARYGASIARLPGVVSLTEHQSPEATWFSAVIAPDPLSGAAANLVHEARALPPPAGTTAYVGGQAASFVDQKHDLASRIPLAVALVVLVTFVVLFLFTGSVVLPIKALVLNALNLTAVLGAMVWIFQEGHLSGLLGFTPSPTNTAMPVLLFCIAFGLSMDYEVYLLSRIKELHVAGASNEEAVVGGLARTGRIMTTAAGILAVSFFAFALSRVSFIQLFGIGTGLAILVDATLVRGVLVPAFMRLAGDANWWSPAPLRRFHRRIGLSEDTPLPAPTG